MGSSAVAADETAIEQPKKRGQAALDAAESEFQNSDLLKSLLERTEANRETRQRELRDRYCRRQAELGVGDCAGLRLIPGATRSGAQKRPDWLDSVAKKLGVIEDEDS